MHPSALLSGLVLSAGVAFAVPYEEYIYAPSSRTLHPTSVLRTNGSVTGASNIAGQSSNGTATLQGASSISYDFGINIAGVASFSVCSVSTSDEFVGITFSESSFFVSDQYSDSTADWGHDETLWFHVTQAGEYKVDRAHERGGFRYLTIVHNTTGDVSLDEVTVDYTPMPHWDDLKAYSGYFHSNDELLNKIWYAGAYTNQICTIDSNHGDSLVFTLNNPEGGPDDLVPWNNTVKITNGTTALVDGAKRDRLVWPGDMSVAVPAIAVSTYDMITIENSLDSLFNLQKANGQLPYAGVGFRDIYSATYHLYSLIGLTNHFLYTGKTDYLESHWDQLKLAISFSLGFVDETGLMNVTSSADWLRFGMGAHNIEANAILYHTLQLAIDTATYLNDSSASSNWTTTAQGIKSAANSILWNEDVGLYNDNETTTALQPQDGNSWAIFANLTDSADKNTRISQNLVERWTPVGAPAPEAANAVSPFISSFELQAHLLAANDTAALDLIRLQWGYMLNNVNMTQSTFIEGYVDTGELHYPPYSQDARISHAHGWATGPTSVLTEYIAGLKVLETAGSKWQVKPQLGGLTNVDAGFSTSLGSYAAKIDVEDGKLTMTVEAPEGTEGEIVVPNVGCQDGTITWSNNGEAPTQGGASRNVDGGEWTVTCNTS